MATSYFENFPRILYSQDTKGRELNVIPDLLRRVKIVEVVNTQNVIYDLYDVKDGETPDQVADKFYNDPTLHWIVLLTNEILDPRFQWLMSETDLKKYTISKYGSEDAIHEVHHVVGYGPIKDDDYYEESNFILAPETTSLSDPIRIIFEGVSPVGNDADMRVPFAHETNTSITRYVTNIEYEQAENEKRRRIKLMRPDIVGELVAQLQKIITQ